jgi:hypothetical protein
MRLKFHLALLVAQALTVGAAIASAVTEYVEATVTVQPPIVP